VVLAAHCVVLDHAFAALEEMQSSTPGIKFLANHIVTSVWLLSVEV
jgi:hypothetical protein